MREANESSTKTEASTLACRHSDARRERVKESKRGERGNTDREDLTEVRLLGVENNDGDKGDNEALDKVLEE
jgi:hypothetical protein